MHLGGLIFFGFLGAIIIVPQVLRYQERARLHETLRMAFERGQPVPPELVAALQSRRRGGYDPLDPEVVAGWRTQPAAATPGAGFPADQPAGVVPPPMLTPIFLSQSRRDLRRGLILLAVGLGLVAAGGASYAGLYEVGGAGETFATFAAFGAVPAFIGLTYLALAWFARDKTRV